MTGITATGERIVGNRGDSPFDLYVGTIDEVLYHGGGAVLYPNPLPPLSRRQRIKIADPVFASALAAGSPDLVVLLGGVDHDLLPGFGPDWIAEGAAIEEPGLRLLGRVAAEGNWTETLEELTTRLEQCPIPLPEWVPDDATPELQVLTAWVEEVVEIVYPNGFHDADETLRTPLTPITDTHRGIQNGLNRLRCNPSHP